MELKFKFEANYIGEVWAVPLTVVMQAEDCDPGEHYADLSIDSITDEATGRTYTYAELDQKDQAELMRKAQQTLEEDWAAYAEMQAEAAAERYAESQAELAKEDQ